MTGRGEDYLGPDPPRIRENGKVQDAQAPLKQIRFMRHDKLDTTARYVNDEQKFGGEAVSKVADIS